MGVLIKEQINFDRENPTVTATYKTTASTVIEEGRAFMGGVQFIGGELQWVPPAVHRTGLICLSASSEIDYANDGAPDASDICDLVVVFGIPERDEDEDQELGSIDVDLGGEMLQLERGAFKFTEGSKDGEKLGDEDVRPFKFIADGAVSVSRNFVVNPNLSGTLAYAGKINNSTLILPGLYEAVPTGFARFDGAKVSRKFSTDGHRFFKVDYQFAVASHHWNKVWDGEQYSSVSPPLYETANLNGVFSG